MNPTEKPTTPDAESGGEADLESRDGSDAHPRKEAGAVLLRDVQGHTVTGWLWTMAYVGASLPLTVLTNILVARSLGADGYGSLAYLMTVLALSSSIISLGIGAGVGRFSAVHHGTGDIDSLKRLIRSFNSISTLWVGSTTGIVVILLTDAGPIVALLILTASFLNAYCESSSLLLPAIQRSDRNAINAGIGTFLLNVAVLVAAVVTRDPVTVFTVRFVVGAGLAPIRLLFVPRHLRRACLTFSRPTLPRDVVRFGSIVYVSGLLATLVYSRTEVILLDYFELTSAVGIFALAFGLAGHVTAPVDSAIGPLSAGMTGAIARDPTATRRLLLRSYRAMFAVGLLWAAMVLVPVTFLVPIIYGSQFAEAGPVFAIGALASFIQTMATPAESLATAVGKPSVVMVANLIGFVTGTGTALFLIPVFGLYGAVLGSITGQITTTGILVAVSFRTAKLGGAAAGTLLRALLLLTTIGGVAFVSSAVSLPAAAALWLLSMVATLLALRTNRFLNWDQDEVDSVLNSAPRRFKPILRHAFPRR